VAEPAAPAAVAAARERPELAVGLHVVVVGGRTALPASALPRLATARKDCSLAGRFPENPVWAGLRYAFDRRVQAELERELRAQFERFARFGLPMSHVDGHLHLHMHPFVFDRVAALAEEFGCRRIRIPREDW